MRASDPETPSRAITPPRRRLPPFGRALVLPAISAVLLVIVLALPELGPPVSGPQVVTAYHARVVALLDPRRPDPSGDGAGFLPDARVLMLEGPDAGKEIEA